MCGFWKQHWFRLLLVWQWPCVYATADIQQRKSTHFLYKSSSSSHKQDGNTAAGGEIIDRTNCKQSRPDHRHRTWRTGSKWHRHRIERTGARLPCTRCGGGRDWPPPPPQQQRRFRRPPHSFTGQENQAAERPPLPGHVAQAGDAWPTRPQRSCLICPCFVQSCWLMRGKPSGAISYARCASFLLIPERGNKWREFVRNEVFRVFDRIHSPRVAWGSVCGDRRCG